MQLNPKKKRRQPTKGERTRTPSPEVALRNRSVEELRNKIQRTVYAIVDYHCMVNRLALTETELYKLMEAAEQGVYEGAGYK